MNPPSVHDVVGMTKASLADRVNPEVSPRAA
jgi:hypothetical protein